MAQTVHFVHLRPYGGVYTTELRHVFEFCYIKRILGVGWSVTKNNFPIVTDFVHYTALFRIKHGAKNFSSVLCINKMTKGDLAWVRDPDWNFYLAEVRGPWMYVDTPLHDVFDIHNVRDVEYKFIDLLNVPSGIKDKVFRRAAQRVRNSDTVNKTIDLWKSYYTP